MNLDYDSGLSFTLSSDEALAFDLIDTALTFTLSDDSSVSMTLSNDATMAFDLTNDTSVAFTLKTPSVIGVEDYEGDYSVTPKTYAQTLSTKNKRMTDDVTVVEIPYYETSNTDGTTVYIANTIA